jgi:hypothetical protein
MTRGKDKSLPNEIKVVVVDPNGGKVVRHTERNGLGGKLDAGNRLKPKLKHVFGKEGAKVTFYGVPKAGRRGGGRHGRWAEGRGVIHKRPGTAGIHITQRTSILLYMRKKWVLCPKGPEKWEIRRTES